MDTIIRETLRPFGITRNYRGYPQTVRAIALVLEDESRLLNVTEEIYEVVALQTRCHPSNVERNIRTVVLCAWHTNRPLLVKMAGFTLTALLTGLIFGLLLYRKPVTVPRVLLASAVVCIALNLLLDTLWLDIMYGNSFIALLPARAVKCVINIPIYTLLIRILWGNALSKIPQFKSV